MNNPEIDEAKLPKAMELIETAAALMERKDGDTDKTAMKELAALQKNLRDLTGNKEVDIKGFTAYWSYTDLETVARMALMPKPAKIGLTDAQITEIVSKIGTVAYDEATTDYFLKVLKLETGLDTISDYIFWPNKVGLDLHADLDEIIAKILADKK